MKLVVVGGVAAGASVAARARRLDEDAEIIILERGHHVSFANCGLPYYIGGVIKERERLLVQTPESLRELLNLEVRTGHEVVRIDREDKTLTVRNVDTGEEYTESYDSLALCPGSEPISILLPGVELPQVQVLRRIGDMDRIKALVDKRIAERSGQGEKMKAVVIGAGYIGLEMAENLAHRGIQVTVVEAADHILPPVDHEIAMPVMNHLRSRGIVIHLSAAAAAIVPKGDERVMVELKNHVNLDADLVIMSVGALAMGKPVRMFFTFWGLNVLRRSNPPKSERKALDKMFKMMMPAGPDDLKLSQMNMGGAGTAMIKKVMKDNDVQSVSELINSAIESGAEITACTMTMDLLGITPEDLIDGVTFGGVASFIAASDKSASTLFI